VTLLTQSCSPEPRHTLSWPRFDSTCTNWFEKDERPPAYQVEEFAESNHCAGLQQQSPAHAQFGSVTMTPGMSFDKTKVAVCGG
jgi:hypothetical protein